MARQDQDRERESRRILDRVMREADSSGPSLISRAAGQSRDPTQAGNAETPDAIEYWGTRIGRTLGLLLCVVLLGWLALFMLRNM